METLPIYLPLAFGVTTLATLCIFFLAMRQSAAVGTRKNALWVSLGLAVWLTLHAVLSLNQVYTLAPLTMPPRLFVLAVLPNILAIVLLFSTPAGRRWMDGLPLRTLTFLHVVRIPVELVLLGLFLHHTLPQVMTFEGRNFDILAGITAPFVAYFGLQKGKMNRTLILGWNIVCLGLLLNIIATAFLSAPSPVQQFGRDLPQFALTHFPYIWLPAFVAPLVLFVHLVAIRRLIQGKLA